jgi:NADH dehydrogenase
MVSSLVCNRIRVERIRAVPEECAMRLSRGRRKRAHDHGAGPSKRVLILGGGFGGVYAALELEKRLGGDQDVQITLVNRENFFLFTPMLHEVAASDLDLTNIVSPVRKLLRSADFFEGDVIGVDLPGKTVTVSHGSDRHVHVTPYDYLVVALGSVTNFFKIPGLETRALTMRSLGDAIHLRNRLIAHLEEADTECACDLRESLLTFVVAGGGFAGVETIAGINDFIRDALPFYPHLSEQMVRMVLVHPGEVILPELGEELGSYAQEKLAARKIEIRTGTRVAGISDDGVTLSDGSVVRSRTLIWTAGTSPHPTLGMLPCMKDRGRIVVNEYLEVEGFPGVWALGDCAVVPDHRNGKPHPPTAQHALREGKVVAQNIVAAIRDGKKRKFDFAALGQLAAIGRRTGVAKILGFKFSGFTAWFLWRTIYLSKLPRFEKKLRVALDWTLDLFFSKDLVQYLTDRSLTMSQEERVVTVASTNDRSAA